MPVLELFDGPVEIPEPKHGDLDAAALRRAVAVARAALMRADSAIYDGADFEDAEGALRLLEGAALRVKALIAKALPAEVMERLCAPRPDGPSDSGVLVAAGMALLDAIGCGGTLIPGSLPPSGFRPPCGGASVAGSSSSPTAKS